MSLAKYAVAACAIAVTAAAAQAGTITSASGAFQVNGADVTLAGGKTLPLKAGDVVDTKGAKLGYRSDKGDDVSFDPGSVIREEASTDASSAVFLKWGSAEGKLSDKTQLGVAAGWISGVPGRGKASVLVETTPGKPGVEAQFRSSAGDAAIQYQSFQVDLAAGHAITLDVDSARPGSLSFRTSQQNPGDVFVRRRTPGGDIIATVPKATLGAFTDEADNKTKICDDINSLKTAKVHIQTKFTKGSSDADIGPGTCALVDNATGSIQVLFTAVKFEILERAISLTSEFSTLAQSNFSDVK